MNNIKQYKKHTQYKLIVMYLAILVPIILVATLETFLDEHLLVDLVIYRYIAFGLVEAAIIYKIVIYHLILAKEEFALKMHTKLTDERNVFIKMKSFNLSFKIIIFVNAIALIASGFLSEIAFYVLLCELLAMLISYFAVYLYYRKKY